ncbi:hypothetical protein EVAR_97754_1 [Eumeta japonica]|uniref:Uncharacterized protein n=1 Tax=Eumeta variegata TaxID=151549 RepID=A0A4C1X8M7_EUMVA|nr:hypothetical protein EVAR_97754_1 [Eumeta japonica]
MHLNFGRGTTWFEAKALNHYATATPSRSKTRHLRLFKDRRWRKTLSPRTEANIRKQHWRDRIRYRFGGNYSTFGVTFTLTEKLRALSPEIDGLGPAQTQGRSRVSSYNSLSGDIISAPTTRRTVHVFEYAV